MVGADVSNQMSAVYSFGVVVVSAALPIHWRGSPRIWRTCGTGAVEIVTDRSGADFRGFILYSNKPIGARIEDVIARRR